MCCVVSVGRSTQLISLSIWLGCRPTGVLVGELVAFLMVTPFVPVFAFLSKSPSGGPPAPSLWITSGADVIHFFSCEQAFHESEGVLIEGCSCPLLSSMLRLEGFCSPNSSQVSLRCPSSPPGRSSSIVFSNLSSL